MLNLRIMEIRQTTNAGMLARVGVPEPASPSENALRALGGGEPVVERTVEVPVGFDTEGRLCIDVPETEARLGVTLEDLAVV